MGDYKIKYEILDDLFYSEDDDDFDEYNKFALNDYKNSRAFHIDLSCMINYLINFMKSQEDIEYISARDLGITITSAVINTIAHYRAYFAKREIYNINIFLYYTEIDINNKLLRKALDHAKTQLDIILKYIPKAYFIYNIDDIDSNVAIYHFIQLHDYNLIMTKNKLLYQYISDSNSSSTSILRPNRDDSYIVNSYNWVEKFAGIDNKRTMPVKSIPLIYSIQGDKEHPGVKRYGAKKSFKRVFNDYIDGYLNSDMDYVSTNDIISDMGIDDKDEIKCIKNNYPIFDLILRYRKLRDVDKVKLNNLIVDNFSNKDLRALNQKYFTGLESLMLQELLMGVTTHKPKKILW